MAIPLVDLKAQYKTIKPEIDETVARIFANTSFIGGPEVATFEDHFRDYCGVEHAIGVSSGTAALQLALMACDIGVGDEVITTPFTFIATAAAITHAGATPVFVDIDEHTYNLDVAKVEAAITPKTRAIMPVHLYGQPVNMAPLLDLAKVHGLRVIEDSAQAIGANYEGTKAGALGDIACFSFYPSKNLGAAGDGGMITTKDEEFAAKIRLLRDHGRTSHYGHGVVGFTYRLDALQAAVLDVKLRYIDQWNDARRERAGWYNEGLAGLPVTTPYEAPGCHAVYHVYALRTPQRDAVYQCLRDQSIGAGIHYPLPVHMQPAYAGMGIPEGSFPVSEAVAKDVISLPIFPEMTREQVNEVVAAITKALT